MAFLKEKIELRFAETRFWLNTFFANFTGWQKLVISACIIGLVPTYTIARSLAYKTEKARLSKVAVSAKPSFTNPEAISVGKVNIASAGKTTFSSFLEIENKNLELSLPETAIEIQFLNSLKQIIHTEKVNIFLLPGQKKNIVVPKIETTDAIQSASVVVPEKLMWQKRLFIPKVSLVAQTPAWFNQTDPTAFVVEGAIDNQSPYALKKVVISYILRGTGNSFLGSSQRSEFDLKPFERRAYKQLWPNVYTNAVTKVEVVAETNVLDSKNLSSPAGTNPASSLGR